MKIELKDVVVAVERAITAVQNDPDQDPADIVNAVIGAIELDPERDSIREEAISRLRRAGEHVDSLGEHHAAGEVNAMIGVGLAILAGGDHD